MEQFKIELIKEFSCNDKHELFAEEERIRSLSDGYYNSYRSILTEVERKEYKAKYDAEHKEQLAKRQAKYDAIHKEQKAKRQANYMRFTKSR